MPRLGHPKIIKGQAIACLLGFYRNEPAFMKELEQLRQPYLEILRRITVGWIIFWAKCAKVLSPRELQELFMNYLEGNEQPTKLPRALADHIGQIRKQEDELQAYKDNLASLALKWKFKASWAVDMLNFFDAVDILSEFDMSTEVDIPFELLDFLYPFPPPYPPFEIKISSWAFVLHDKRQIMSQLNKRLTEYENKLKSEGLRERPSAMEKHANWWFEHYVHKKSYEALADMEAEGFSSTPVTYASTIGKAVRKFSKLIGIDPKALK